MKKLLLMLLMFTLVGATAAYSDTPSLSSSPPGAKVYIISPKDGATVSNPVVVRFGLKDMGVAPAGVKMENTGHHHLFVDSDLPKDLTRPIPAVPDKIIHFGKGQTETTLTLIPGKHTLQLLLGDYEHVPHNPPVMSKKITIHVKK